YCHLFFYLSSSSVLYLVRSFFRLRLLRPPRSSLFPYTTLFRSCSIRRTYISRCVNCKRRITTNWTSRCTRSSSAILFWFKYYTCCHCIDCHCLCYDDVKVGENNCLAFVLSPTFLC